MFETTATSLNLAQVAASGQCFTWRPLADGGWAIPAFGRRLHIRQAGTRFSLSCTPDEWEAVWRGYFDLDTDYDGLKASIDPADAYLCAAARYGGGVRILRQDLWEVMVSFLISQNNNITRITRSIGGLCGAYGAPLGGGLSAFPSPDALAGVPEADFRALGLGYRAGYLCALVQEMRGGGLAAFRAALDAADDGGARALLTGLRGVGPKVADCILLFGLHRMDAFPLDTHIRKVLAAHYPGGFPTGRYAGMLGAVQQYIFYYDLKKGG